MAQENKRGNREVKKPKATKPKTNASAPSTKGQVLAKPASSAKK